MPLMIRLIGRTAPSKMPSGLQGPAGHSTSAGSQACGKRRVSGAWEPRGDFGKNAPRGSDPPRLQVWGGNTTLVAHDLVIWNCGIYVELITFYNAFHNE